MLPAATIGVVAVLSIIVTRPAYGQEYAEVVWRQLQEQYDVVSTLGDYALRSYIMGSMNEDGTESWTFPLIASTDYVITGACDVDCSDIDILVKDAYGNEVNSDVLADDQPIVEFTAGQGGEYTVEIKMYSCAVEPCYFGFGIFER
jgi:hypothetical protein